MKEIIVFTDGSSKGNPGPGGWGAVIATKNEVIELGGGKDNTTNNEMELNALLEALKYIKGGRVHVYSDSRYVLRGIEEWLPGWIETNWITKSKKEVSHRDKWEALAGLLDNFDISFEHVHGHSGILGNERVDDIAQAFSDKKKVDLYNGPRENYPIDLFDLSKTKVGSSDKKKRSRAKAYSYVSLVDGRIETHKMWSECESRVKGVSGAKFEKALDKEEEEKLIRKYSN